MRVFVTGASGYIGNVVARTFREKGHTVYGLVRSQENADLLSLNEIWPVFGELEKLESYAKILEEVEVVVHCAFDATEKGVERDLTFIDAVLNTYSKSSLSHAFIYTSGVWVYGSTGYKTVDEASPLNPIDIVKWRPEHEQKILKATSPYLRTVVMRPGCVYGSVGGLTNFFFTSTQNGAVSMVGNGRNRWTMVHVQDLAHAYVSAAEKEVTGVILNVTDDTNPTVQDLAEAVARSAGKPGQIHSLSSEEAEKQFGSLVQGLTIDQEVNNARIKRLLHWQIHHASFIHDVDIYYNAWKATQQIHEF
jgi:nucleoside-diphosphate-sugar epimerase